MLKDKPNHLIIPLKIESFKVYLVFLFENYPFFDTQLYYIKDQIYEVSDFNACFTKEHNLQYMCLYPNMLSRRVLDSTCVCKQKMFILIHFLFSTFAGYFIALIYDSISYTSILLQGLISYF